jgi:hypothetical protein
MARSRPQSRARTTIDPGRPDDATGRLIALALAEDVGHGYIKS